jgi:putative transposase
MSLNRFFSIMGVTKQAFHQRLDREIQMQELGTNLAIIIADLREDHPTMSCRAMYYKLAPEEIGRDAFEALCRDLGFAVIRPVNYCRTTDSRGITRFDNLIKDLTINRVNQVWSSDITYFEIDGKFFYITFILDNYSRVIVGYSVSERLFTHATTLPAMRMALQYRKHENLIGLIFHSDGGGQYYDREFISLLRAHKIESSMCEAAWENGKAERINGVIKNNYLKPWGVKNEVDLLQKVDRAVRLYNQEKPHQSLNYQIPVVFEKQSVNLPKQTKPKMINSSDAKSSRVGN